MIEIFGSVRAGDLPSQGRCDRRRRGPVRREIVAGGSITVHGALRGRAIAGVPDTARPGSSRRFEAEFLAIDGAISQADALDPKLHGRPVRLRLEGDRLITELME